MLPVPFGQTAIGCLKPTVRNTASRNKPDNAKAPFNRGLRAVSEKTDANSKYQHFSDAELIGRYRPRLEPRPEAVFPGTKLTPHPYLRLSTEHACARQEE